MNANCLITLMNAIKTSIVLETNPYFGTDKAYSTNAIKLLEMATTDVIVSSQRLGIEATCVQACAANVLGRDANILKRAILEHDFTNAVFEFTLTLKKYAEVSASVEYESDITCEYYIHKHVILRDVCKILNSYADNVAVLDILRHDIEDIDEEAEDKLYKDIANIIGTLEDIIIELEATKEEEA